jgi:RIO kinase 1
MIDLEVYEVETRAHLRGQAKHKPLHKPQDIHSEIWSAIVKLNNSAGEAFQPSYLAGHPDSTERMWLRAALVGFYEDSLLNDVLQMVKGGKEASVYCCAAHPATGAEWLAAKVYRPRMLRSLKNDAPYKEGRTMLDEQGKAIRDRRRQLALTKKTRFGGELEITAWIEHEFQTMQMLYDAGADLPRPLAQYGHAILMDYLGQLGQPAPTLNQIELDPAEASRLFARVMWNIERMLACHRIHADLSAYNILYWKGEIKLIDFPQAVDPRTNPNAQAMLARDVMRVCQYLARFGVRADPAQLSDDLWSRYMQAEL